MNIDSILTEWRYRLPAGYPKSAEDFGVLRDVILEMTDIDLSEAESIVRRAMGLDEAPSDEETQTVTNTNQEAFSNANEFEQYVKRKFTIDIDKQEIIGLHAMYDAIISHPQSDQLIQLITGNSVLQLKSGAYPIRGIYNDLYIIIEQTIKIPNGDESELWFAIAYGGLVKGAVAGTTGIEADVEVGTETISLKNYKKATFDFGSLPGNGVLLLNSFLEIAKLLTGTDISKSKGRDQINKVLNFLDNETIESEIRQIINMGETTNITLIKNIANKLQSFYTLDDNLDTMIHAFCNIVDKMVVEKIDSVGWWGMIIKPTKTLFLESSADLVPLLKCKDDRLSPAISSFHQNKLFVLGSQLSTKVSLKSQD